MTYAAVHDAIRARFKAQVADIAGLPVAYPNAPFETPDGSTNWMRLAILDGESTQIELEANSSSTFRRVGVAVVSIFGPAQPDSGSPTGGLMDLADTVAAAFRRVYASPVRYRVPSVQTVGRDGAWWQVNVTWPWESDLVT